ncbi:MAG: amidohydrolase family protein [Chlamydiota bacterium]
MIDLVHLKENYTEAPLPLPSEESILIDASGAILLPAGTDPHVHFRTPGQTYKEDWRSGALASFSGGITRVFDMPNNLPPIVTQQALAEKQKEIRSTLGDLPLKFGLYFGASKDHLDEIHKVHSDIIGIKVFMGSSTGTLLLDDDAALEKVFQIASEYDLLVAVHAEDEARIEERKKRYQTLSPHSHSLVRDPVAAEIAVIKACDLAIKYQVRLYLLHISTQKELRAIEEAKKMSDQVFAEACPHHLFFNDEAYNLLGQKILVNPPIRSEIDRQYLIHSLKTGLIDTVGSDHAPHLLGEKEGQRPPCGVPGTESIFPILWHLHEQEGLSIERIVSLTSKAQERIFRLPKTSDYLLLHTENTLPFRSPSKCGWSPYEGRIFSAAPLILILQDRIMPLSPEGASRRKDPSYEDA